MEFIKNHWKKIIVILVFPLIFPWILHIAYKYLPGQTIGTVDGWIGFLGAYFGVIGAIAVVWWQLSEEKKKEKIESLKKEVYAVVTFLILFRESCENYFYMLNNYDELNNNNFKIKSELFYKAIQDTEIVMMSNCIELLYFFDKFSINNKVMVEIYDNYHDMLKELFETLYETIDIILTDYETIKKIDNNYLKNLHHSYLENDLNSLFTVVNDIIKKYEKQKD